MDAMLVVSILVTVLFFVIKFVETRYLEKDPAKQQPLKDTVRDTIIVLCSSLVACFVYFNLNTRLNEFFNVITETKVLNPESTMVFTDAPGF